MVRLRQKHADNNGFHVRTQQQNFIWKSLLTVCIFSKRHICCTALFTIDFAAMKR